MYLDEQKVNSLHQAGILADDYSLTHKTTFPSKLEQSGIASDHKRSKAGRHTLHQLLEAETTIKVEAILTIWVSLQEDLFVIIVRSVVI